MTGAVEGYAAFVATGIGTDLSTRCHVVSVTPLLRELLIRCANLPLFYEETDATARMVAVLIDELAAAGAEDLHLPMPADPR